MRGDEHSPAADGDVAHARFRQRGSPTDVFVAGDTPLGWGVAFDLPIPVGPGSLRPGVSRE